METDNPDVVPTASMVMNGPLGQPPISQPAPAPAATPAPEPTAEKLILGKFKTPDDLAKAYTELESAHGRNAQELGETRKQNDILSKAFEMMPKSTPQETKQTAPGRDFNAELQSVQQKVEAGEISTAEALNLTSQITEERTLARARQEYQQFEAQNKVQTAEQQFLSKNPDFERVVNSPEARQILRENPLYTNLNAYQEIKAQEKIAALAKEKETAVQEALEKGKSQIQQLADGSRVADATISKPGTGVREAKPPKTFDQREIRESMKAAYDRATGGGG